METVRVVKNERRAICIFIGLLAFFLGMFLLYGVGVYNDSEQYITMHIHREPLYPLFLAFFRGIFGDGYLSAAAVVQNILTACSIFALTEYIAKHFYLGLWEELTVAAIQIIPHLGTRYASSYHIFVENSIMSEALCFPLFNFFFLFLLLMVFRQKKRDVVLALLFAFLLSLTRGQMMTTLLLWMVVILAKLLLQKKYRLLAVPVAAVLLTFGMRSLTVHGYNYFVTGYFMGNTYGKVNTLTNVIYACDEEDGVVFAQDSQEKEFFERFYADADAAGINYRYGGDTFWERARHLEEYHDVLKFQIIETRLSAYFFSLGKVDYYQQSEMSDKMAGVMLRKLLPVCFGQWLYDYMLLCAGGFIRSIAVVHPVLNWAALFLYAAGIGLAAWGFWQGRVCERSRDAALMMSVALLFIAANVCATSLTIMCLSRYMIYGFAGFYTALFLLVIQKGRKRGRK